MKNLPNPNLWSITGSLGYTNYQNMYKNDGQTVIGRFAIGREMLFSRFFVWGLEAGVQNGNTMRLSVPQAILDDLGGLPIQSTTKPLLDLLVTLKIISPRTTAFFTQFKAGVAYRHWQFDNRDSINDKSQLAGEVQAGLGYEINKHANLSVLYQGIFGANPHFRANTRTETASISNIPAQHGLLLSLAVFL